MKIMKIYYVLFTHEFDKNAEDEHGDVYPEIERCFESYIEHMTTDYKNAEYYLKETIRSVRGCSDYEERVGSETYYTNHYAIVYKDCEKITYEIRWHDVVMPEQDKELA